MHSHGYGNQWASWGQQPGNYPQAGHRQWAAAPAWQASAAMSMLSGRQPMALSGWHYPMAKGAQMPQQHMSWEYDAPAGPPSALLHDQCSSSAWWHADGTSQVGSSDEERELMCFEQVQQLVAQGDLESAKAIFLKMRELWREAKSRFKDRDLSFAQFNSRYQTAFNLLRRASEHETPARHSKLIQRHYLRLSTGEPQEPGPAFASELRVMSFNVLSEALNDLFSYQFVALPPGAGDFLRWDLRSKQIVAEVQRWQPSLLCLQELDLDLAMGLFRELKKHAGLENLDVVQRNVRSKDGLCFLYNPKLLRLVQPVSVTFPDRQNAVLTAIFEVTSVGHPGHGRRIGALTTHVAGMAPACTEDIMRSLVDRAEQLRQSGCDAIIMAGDLNGCDDAALNLAWANGYDSAYQAAGDVAMASGGPVVTAHNDEYHWCGELDFVLYDMHLLPTGIAQIPGEERLVPIRSASHPTRSLPHPGWPSDHMSLVVDFEFQFE
eukprot:TRINITY_DN11215_c0_g1_i2.p1 TRINITY_DN11215_c0_g1~~TRINITY_DN11215_c0_g1_i2.p1  ORF type:complete len:492 (+),score=79.75 TRINITY_DN11215_c0_g1_i2:187-1662(+)